MTDACKDSAQWKAFVREEASRFLNSLDATRRAALPLRSVAIHLAMTFSHPRPKSHFTGSGRLKSSAPRHPISRPDVLKLARAVEDALTSVIWHDDAQIVSEILLKRWCDGPPHVELLIAYET